MTNEKLTFHILLKIFLQSGKCFVIVVWERGCWVWRTLNCKRQNQHVRQDGVFLAWLNENYPSFPPITAVYRQLPATHIQYFIQGKHDAFKKYLPEQLNCRGEIKWNGNLGQNNFKIVKLGPCPSTSSNLGN